MTYSQSAEYKHALAQFCQQGQPEYFLTLAFHIGRPVDIYWAEKRLHHFAARIDYKLLGCNWATKPTEQRTQFIAIPEGQFASNHGVRGLHYHASFKSAPGKRSPMGYQALSGLIDSAWKHCVPSGDINFQPMKTAEDQMRAAAYMCKRLQECESIGIEHFVLEPRSTYSGGRADSISRR